MMLRLLGHRESNIRDCRVLLDEQKTTDITNDRVQKLLDNPADIDRMLRETMREQSSG